MSASVAVIGSWKRTRRWYRRGMGDDTGARALRTRLARGELTAVDALPLLPAGALEAAAARGALTEIRSPAGRAAAREVLDRELEPEVQIAAVRYLAELGALEVLPVLRRLARSEAAEIRIAASFASRALKAARDRDAGERFLVALKKPTRT